MAMIDKPDRQKPRARVGLGANAPKLAWDELVKIEPQLSGLAKEASAYKKNSRNDEVICANDRWYGYGQWRDKGIKPRLIYLVGWCAARPELKTMEAYDVAYQHLYHLLPDCENCGCIGYQ